jgi:enoyl-CoA hydratase/carnithine racemase
MDTLDTIVQHGWTRLRVSSNAGIVTVQLARTAERNALDPALMSELTDIAARLKRSPQLRAVILCGAEDFFSAGADLKSSRHRGASGASLLELRAQVAAGPDLCQAWEDIEAVTIAAIEGFCIGGACALVVACDFRIMAEGAYLRLPEVPLGMNMSWRTLPRLEALIGPSRAKQFVLFGEAASAADCIKWGLADELCPKGGARRIAATWAEKVASLPPIPVRMTKEAINAAAHASATAVSFMDRDQFLLSSRSSDYAEGLAAFLEKRPPHFRGD